MSEGVKFNPKSFIAPDIDLSKYDKVIICSDPCYKPNEYPHEFLATIVVGKIGDSIHIIDNHLTRPENYSIEDSYFEYRNHE